MDKEILNQEVANHLLNAADSIRKARIFEGTTQRPFSVQKVVIALDTAKLSTDPLQIKFPFKSFYVQDATDVNVTIDIQVGSRDSTQSLFTVKKNDSWDCEYPVTEAYLSWSAQTGKTITLVFFTDAAFRSGSQVSVTGGSLSISEGSSFTTTRVDLTAATAMSVVASLSTRKVANIQNNTGGDVWFGNSSVSNTGANLGLKIPAGAIYQWRNSAALYAYSVAGGTGDNGLLVKEEI